MTTNPREASSSARPLNESKVWPVGPHPAQGDQGETGGDFRAHANRTWQTDTQGAGGNRSGCLSPRFGRELCQPRSGRGGGETAELRWQPAGRCGLEFEFQLELELTTGADGCRSGFSRLASLGTAAFLSSLGTFPVLHSSTLDSELRLFEPLGGRGRPARTGKGRTCNSLTLNLFASRRTTGTRRRPRPRRSRAPECASGRCPGRGPARRPVRRPAVRRAW